MNDFEELVKDLATVTPYSHKALIPMVAEARRVGMTDIQIWDILVRKDADHLSLVICVLDTARSNAMRVPKEEK